MTRRFFRYTSQNILAMIGISFYVLADAIFIAKYAGPDGLVALNLALPLFGIIEGLGAMVGTGFATVYAIDKASGHDSRPHFLQAIFWCLVFGLPISIIGLTGYEKVITLLGAQGHLVQMGGSYARILMSMAPMFMFNFVMNAFARNDNAPSIAMVATLTGSIMNVILDYIFMFVLDWGFASAALATVLSPTISVCILCFHYFGKRNHVPMRFSVPDFRLFAKSCALGLSSFMSHISSGITVFVFNTLILGLSGSIGVAAYSIIANIAYIPAAIYGGIADGAQPLLSECHGKDDPDGVRHILKLGMCMIGVLAFVIVLCCHVFVDPMVRIFNDENSLELATMARESVRLYSLGFVVSGLGMMFISFFSATDRPVPEILGSLSRGCVAIVLCAVLMARLFGMTGIWLSFPAAEAITVLLLVGLFLWYDRR